MRQYCSASRSETGEPTDLNQIPNNRRLLNRYYVMRHGHSLANERGIIVSRPESGCEGFGLSELGRRQVSEGIAACSGLDRSTVIVSSDFSRALESARIAHVLLDCRLPLRIDERLRERNFGSLELGSTDAYAQVWQEDAADPDSEALGVESANSVMRRVTSLIADYESSHRDSTLLLVSHGDALQLLQTAFLRRDASRHRSLEHLKTAEVRRLQPAE